MPELFSKDRLQPSLLDRLRDDHPTSATESIENRAISVRQLREAVRRDLGFLFNATHLAAVQDLSAYPEVARSTLNYGIPDLAGRQASTIDRGAVARDIRAAIGLFEPRLLAASLKVQVTLNPGGSDPNALRFDIESDLWAEPLPLRLRLRTEMNLEDAEAVVREVSGP